MFRNYAGNALVTYKKTLHLTNVQKQVLIGTLLGDASMATQQGNHGHYVKFEQKLGYAYLDHLYQILKPFVHHEFELLILKEFTRSRVSVWALQTRFVKALLRFILPFGSTWISSPFTCTTSQATKILVSPMALAYWFMDDGSYQAGTNSNSRYTYFICTHSFNFADQILATL